MYILKVNKFFFLLFLIFISCDKIKVSPEDVIKYDWLNPFVFDIEKNSFEGTHDIDTGQLKFNYKLVKSNNILNKLDSIALTEKWEIKNKTLNSRQYIKNIILYESSLERIVIDIKTEGNSIFFNVE